MSNPKRTSGSADYSSPSSYNDQFIKSDPHRTSGSSSLPSALEPPPIPPPDYTPISREEWAKTRMPPLKGIIAEPEWRPSQAEANKVLGLDKHAPAQAGSAADEPAPQQDPHPQSSLYRSSGTSDILGRAAEAPDGRSYNLMPGGTRHSAGGEKFGTQHRPTFTQAVANVVTNPVTASKSLLLMPSFRTAMLTGIASGFVMGGALWSVGKRVPKAANGAVATFMVTNIVTFLWCESRRDKEKKQARLVQEVWEESRLKKAGEWERLKAERERRLRETGLKGSEEARDGSSRSWFWGSGDRSRGREG